MFDELKKRSNILVTELDAINSSIDADKRRYETETGRLAGDIDSFNRRAESGYFSSQSQFRYEREQLLSRSNQLEELRSYVNENIAKFTTLRDELVALSVQTEDLNRSINSSLAPAPSL